MIVRFAVVAAYLATIVAANQLTAQFGPLPMGLGLTATAGTYAAGATLLMRDVAHDIGGRPMVVLAIIGGTILSAVVTTPRLALTSGVAFLVAETADMLIYVPLRRRGWVRAVLVSNLLGSIVDTALFLVIAGLPVLAARPASCWASSGPARWPSPSC
ncbi:VUT family protein [Streptosporangium lutulentum]